MSKPSSSFKELLLQLEAAHEREISLLEEELEELTQDQNHALIGDDSVTELKHVLPTTPTCALDLGEQLWPEWFSERQLDTIAIASKTSLDVVGLAFTDQMEVKQDRCSFSRFCFPNWQFLPDSFPLLWWQILGLVVLMYDLISIPMQVFDLEPTSDISVIGTLVSLYWICDLLVAMNTAVVSETGETLQNRKIAVIQYAKSWLLLDLGLIIFDLYVFISKLNSQSAVDIAGVARSGRLARMARLLRLLRLLRLAKLRQLVFSLQSLIDSEWVTLIFCVIRNLFSILVSTHYIACFWFLVGLEGGTDEDPCWGQRLEVWNKGMMDNYINSMLWSLAQVTPGSSSIQPKCQAESYFVAFVLIYGLIMGTCFISSITTIMSAVWSLSRYTTTQKFLIKKFLKEKNIPRSLSSRVIRYIDYVVELRHKTVHPSKVHFLNLLSGPLNSELQYAMYGQVLGGHPFLQALDKSASNALNTICVYALTNTVYGKNDVLFHERHVTKDTFFVIKGALAYSLITKGGGEKKFLSARLAESDWCCEATIWMHWFTKGDMRSVSEVDALLLDSEKLRETLKTDPKAMAVGKKHAIIFLSENETRIQSDIGMTDIPVHLQENLNQELNTMSEAEREIFHSERSDIETWHRLHMLEASEKLQPLTRPSALNKKKSRKDTNKGLSGSSLTSTSL